MIKMTPAPPGYRTTHVHRENPDQAREGGLAIVYRDSIHVSPRNQNITHTSFEFQLVNIGPKSRDIVLANIYRPPSSSISIFLEEFGSILATLGTDVGHAADRLMICGDFNLPGMSPDKMDDDLADLLNSTCFTQHVNASTRPDSLRATKTTPCLMSSSPHPFQNLFLQHPLSVPTKFLAMTYHWLTSRQHASSPQRSYQYRDIKILILTYSIKRFCRHLSSSYRTINSVRITILTLDMSAAFDTLDHTTLLHRLQHTFGLSGYVISWVRSYLTYRTRALFLAHFFLFSLYHLSPVS